MAYPITGITAPTVEGPGAVPTGSTSVTTDTVYLSAVIFSASGGTSRTVTITNTAGDVIMKDLPVTVGVDWREGLPFIKMVGIKWVASGAGITGQLQYHAS